MFRLAKRKVNGVPSQVPRDVNTETQNTKDNTDEVFMPAIADSVMAARSAVAFN